MSLLIDALKRAERAKSGQAEPPLSNKSTIERAVNNDPNPLDWQLSDPLPEPKVNETVAVADASERPEPKLGGTIFSQDTAPAKVAPSALDRVVISPPLRPAPAANTPPTTADREAAKTLFAAKRAAPRNRASMLALGGLAALLLAGGGFYVWYSLAFPPSPVRQPVLARVPVPAAPEAAVVPVPSITPPVAATTEVKEPVAAPAIPPPAQTAIEKSEPIAKPEKRKRAAIASFNTTETATSSEETVRREIEQAKQIRGAAPRRSASQRDDIRLDTGERRTGGVDPDIAQAYDALISGSRGEAKRLYNLALDRDPFSTDALLGLATIAGNQGNIEGAEQLYHRALELDPQNPAALAGLSSVRQQGGPSESQIKFELSRSPDSAALHFALGNQYANQGRWNEAQQAYFDAFGLDGRNPDYAYNLAVSLDQISQGKLAKNYYRRALELAANRPARFNAAAIKTRLAELSQTE